MIIIKNLTELVKYKNVEMENRLYELFTATVSHEMRTPLNSILSLIKVIMLSISDLRIKKLLNIILSSSELLKYQVSEMLDLFSLKTNRFKKEEKSTNVREEIVEEVVRIVREPCSQKGLALQY
jgi:signal transduction histidine kinase